MSNLYYKPPTKKIFNEVKNKAIAIWDTYDNTYGYRDEKVNRIKDLENINDNLMYIVAMFDIYNQFKLSRLISSQARKAIGLRLLAGGTPLEFNIFI